MPVALFAAAHLDKLLPILQQAQQLSDEGIQVASQDLLIAVFAEVHDGSGCVRLYPWLIEVLHDVSEGWDYRGMLLVLDVRAKICAHLPDCLACRPPHFGVGVLQALCSNGKSTVTAGQDVRDDASCPCTEANMQEAWVTVSWARGRGGRKGGGRGGRGAVWETPAFPLLAMQWG